MNLRTYGDNQEMLNRERESFAADAAKLSESGADKVVRVEQIEDGIIDSSIRVFRTFEEIEEIRDVWSSWHQHPNSDIDFYSLIVRSRPEMLRPHVVVHYRDGVPDAMLVGRIERARLEFRVGYKTFYRAKVRQLTLVHRGELGTLSPQNCDLLIRQVMHSLRRGEADVAFFNFVRTDSSLYASASELPGFLSRDHFGTAAIQRSTTLPSTVEDVYQRLSGKARKTLKRQARKILSDFEGKVQIRTFSKTAELDDAIRDVERIAKKTYQRGLGVGFCDDENMRRQLVLEAERGWLRIHVLYIGEKPCTFWIGCLYGQTFHSNFLGYDPEYAKYSIGMYLVVTVLENFIIHAVTDQPERIDWGLGDAQYKEVLGDQNWQETSLYIFAKTFRGILLNTFRTPVVFIDEILKKVLERTKLLQKVKKIWRDRARQRQSPGQSETPSENA